MMCLTQEGMACDVMGRVAIPVEKSFMKSGHIVRPQPIS
jgi:hypothetical protein